MEQEYNYKEPLEHILKVLVDHPEELDIRQESEGTVVTLYITANPEDYGPIIGKRGQMINNIRNILKVKAVKDGVKLNINIDDSNVEKEDDDEDAVEETPLEEVELDTEDTEEEESEEETEIELE